MTDIVKIVEELDELMEPYLVCICESPVEAEFIPLRFTFRCECGGVIPLKKKDIAQPGAVQ